MTKLIWLLAFAQEINGAIDKGKVRVNVKEMRGILRQGKLFEFLNKHADEFGTTVYAMTDPGDRDYINRQMTGYALYEQDVKGEKLGVENGLCLLLGFLITVLQNNVGQQQATWDPPIRR